MSEFNIETSLSFGREHIIEPRSAHTHTAILLHGRGSDGEEFAEEIAATLTSDGKTLFEKLPGWRWVLPSSKELWSTAFQEEIPAWFEAHSLTDTSGRQDLQLPGLLEAVAYTRYLIRRETGLLSEKVGNLLLGGISQGGAVALCALVSGSTAANIGAFLAASTWMPFIKNIERIINDEKNSEKEQSRGDGEEDYHDAIKAMIGRPTAVGQDHKLPVFLGHGQDDAYVDVELGRAARDVLMAAGLDVAWKEYSDAEQEGHWLQAPDEMDDIYNFMKSIG